jgi:hypothetical protein
VCRAATLHGLNGQAATASSLPVQLVCDDLRRSPAVALTHPCHALPGAAIRASTKHGQPAITFSDSILQKHLFNFTSVAIASLGGG